MLVRQAHPGPDAPAYHDETAKRRDAERYRQAERPPWPMAVDDLAGTVHQAYGGLSDAAYLIGVDGRVSFFGVTAGAPQLHRAVAELVERGGSGTVGTDFVPRIVSALPDGWPAIERGLPQSAEELAATLPGSVALMRAGHALQPVLAPVTHRSRPLPAWVRKAFVVATLALATRHLTRRTTRGPREGTP